MRLKHKQDKYSWWYIGFSTTNPGYDHPAQFKLILGSHGFSLELDNCWIKPAAKWRESSLYPGQSVKEEFTREWSISCAEDAIFFRWGLQSHDSVDNPKTTLVMIPWKEAQRTKYEIYNADWTLAHSVIENDDRVNFKSIEEGGSKVVKDTYSFYEHGKLNEVSIYFTEMKWEYGKGFWKWVRLFKKPVVRIRAEIQFKNEAGSRAGEWKGGAMSMSLDVTRGETTESVIERLKNYSDSRDTFNFSHIKKV